MTDTPFRTGADHFLDAHLDSGYRGLRCALLSHQAALLADGRTTAQGLRDALGDSLCALFGPEHGYFGLAGAGVATVTEPHPEWGIPVYSLYGEFRKPTPEMLAGLDCVFIDFQDLGVRCYTYVSTLRRMLEACAEQRVRVVVLDRPIPLPGIVDGPMLDPAFRSFVADSPLHMVYGMTPGETARWMAETLGMAVDLKIVAPVGWRRTLARQPDFPEWIPPSPGIRTWETAQAYPATVFCEALPAVDNGRGTNLAFRVVGAPWAPVDELLARLADLPTPGTALVPHRWTCAFGPSSGETLTGLRIAVADPAAYRPATLSVSLLQAFRAIRPDIWATPDARPAFFDKLYGTDQVR